MVGYIDAGLLKNDHKFLRPYNDTARAQISPYRVPDSVLQLEFSIALHLIMLLDRRQLAEDRPFLSKFPAAGQSNR